MTIAPAQRPGTHTTLIDHENRVRALERNRSGDRMPWVLFSGSLTGQTIPNHTDYFPELTGLLVSPLNAGGTVDEAVYGAIFPDDSEGEIMTGGSSNEPFKSIKIRQPGLYYYSFDLIWKLSWGPARVEYDMQSTGPSGSVLPFRLMLWGIENGYFGGFSDAGTPQVVVHAQTIVAVDERATDVHWRGIIRNQSGSSQTPGGGDPPIFYNFSIVRLSESGHSR